jgi:hypothetical protein
MTRKHARGVEIGSASAGYVGPARMRATRFRAVNPVQMGRSPERTAGNRRAEQCAPLALRMTGWEGATWLSGDRRAGTKRENVGRQLQIPTPHRND